MKFINLLFIGLRFGILNLGGAAAAVGIASGLGSIFGGGSSGGGGGGSQGTTAGGTIYDPFSPYRAQAGAQLSAMMQPGAQFSTSDPSYSWRFGQGQKALESSLGAQHLLGSGNRLAALVNYGQGAASQEFSNQFSRLAAMAGAGSWSGSNMGNLQAQQQQAGYGALAQGLGGLASIYGGGNSPGYSPSYMGGGSPSLGYTSGGYGPTQGYSDFMSGSNYTASPFGFY